MKKKFICTVCGYVHEGDEAPERCPQCKAPREKFKEVIESNNGEYDLVGWDIKKALYLHFKSNPNLREWLISPIVYIPDTIGIFDGLPEFIPQILKYHYYRLAYGCL